MHSLCPFLENNLISISYAGAFAKTLPRAYTSIRYKIKHWFRFLAFYSPVRRTRRYAYGIWRRALAFENFAVTRISSIVCIRHDAVHNSYAPDRTMEQLWFGLTPFSIDLITGYMYLFDSCGMYENAIRLPYSRIPIRSPASHLTIRPSRWSAVESITISRCVTGSFTNHLFKLFAGLGFAS